MGVLGLMVVVSSTMLVNIDMMWCRMVMGTVCMSATMAVSVSMTVSVTVTMSMTHMTFIAVNFLVNFFIDYCFFFVTGLTSVLLLIFIFIGTNLLLDVTRAFNNFIVFVALDHADMVVIIVMIVFVLIAVVVVGFPILGNDTLTFNICVVDDGWNIHTSCVENAVNLILPHAITVITS